MLSKEAIIEGLEALNIRRDDIVIVHSSLSRLGLVDGGPLTVVNAIRELIGKNGTLVVPTIHLRVSAVEHFKDYPLFDVRSTKSTMGIISETVRTLPEAKRSLHPTHSVAAIGLNKDYIVADHHKSEDPFGSASPYYRLAEFKGKILLLGVPLANMTNFHVVEAMAGEDFPYPVFLDYSVNARVINYDDEEIYVRTKIHNPEISALRRCNEMEGQFKKYDIVDIGNVGKARTLVIDAFRLNEVLLDLLTRHITMYTPNGVYIKDMLK